MAGSCSEPECDRPAIARGLCARCYARFRRNDMELPPLSTAQAEPDEIRFWSKVARPGQHWLWLASKQNRGYGFVFWQGKMQLAHRVAWELVVGPIPDGVTLDHLRDLCGNTACVKVIADEFGPAHLQPVSHRTNVLRGVGPTADNFRKTHCIHDHEFTPENTIIRVRNGATGRACRICTREGNARRVRKWRERQRKN